MFVFCRVVPFFPNATFDGGDEQTRRAALALLCAFVPTELLGAMAVHSDCTWDTRVSTDQEIDIVRYGGACFGGFVHSGQETQVEGFRKVNLGHGDIGFVFPAACQGLGYGHMGFSSLASRSESGCGATTWLASRALLCASEPCQELCTAPE